MVNVGKYSRHGAYGLGGGLESGLLWSFSMPGCFPKSRCQGGKLTNLPWRMGSQDVFQWLGRPCKEGVPQPYP